MQIRRKERQLLKPGNHTIHCTSITRLNDGERVLANFREEAGPASFPVGGVEGFSAEDAQDQLAYFLDALGIPEISLDAGETIRIDAIPCQAYLREKDGFMNWVLQSFRPVVADVEPEPTEA